MSRAFIFPGQGSQAVGMGSALSDAFPVAREVFEEVDDALGEKLSELMREGPAEELTLTENAQPALMAVSIAVMRVLEKEANADIGKSAFAAGHSLGEYSALCAAGALSLGDAARLLRTRGKAMQSAVPVGEGAMAALIGLEIDAVSKAIAQAAGKGVCEIANDNSPGQIVISGAVAKVDAVIEAAKALGAKKAVSLPVSAPFHCALMKPAAEIMKAALADTPVSPPRPAIVANVTAEPATDPDKIRTLLYEQVTGRVRWRESVAHMVERGVDQFIEVGSGKVLSGLVKRINRDAATLSVGEPTDVDAFLKL